MDLLDLLSQEIKREKRIESPSRCRRARDTISKLPEFENTKLRLDRAKLQNSNCNNIKLFNRINFN